MQDSENILSNAVCVLIPTYNNDQSLRHVIQSVLQYTQQVIVVNDGSTDQTQHILDEFKDLIVVTQPLNRGKGLALRMGFKKAVEMGYSHVVTIDSDGQHFAEDLPRFFEIVAEKPNALVIGVRNMEQSSVPGKSSFGNKFSNFWYWVETGLKQNDTQSGYRLYPVKNLSGLKWYTRKFEFEIEVLVRSAWRGIEIAEVPVKVFYADPSVRVSHFRPFKDFTRISILNAFLVTIAIAYIKPRDFLRSLRKKKIRETIRKQIFNPDQSDALKAFSIGFGAFIGIIPIWGFQLAVGIPLSMLMRLNTALVVLTAHISIPPMIPIILFFSHYTGRIWMGDQKQYISFSQNITLETVRNNVEQYFLGAITLAVMAGITFGAISFLIMRMRRKVAA